MPFYSPVIFVLWKSDFLGKKKKKKVFQKAQYWRQYKHFIGLLLAETGGQAQFRSIAFQEVRDIHGMFPLNCCVHPHSKWHCCNVLNISAEVMGPVCSCQDLTRISHDDCMSGTCLTWADSLEQPLVMRGCRPNTAVQYCFSKAAKQESLSKEQEIWGWWVKDVLA